MVAAPAVGAQVPCSGVSSADPRGAARGSKAHPGVASSLGETRCQGVLLSGTGPREGGARQKHGLNNPQGQYAGDLPNLVVAANGQGEVEGKLEGATLEQGPSSLLGPQGTALIVHASPEDAVTDPAGASGDRIACGVIGW